MRKIYAYISSMKMGLYILIIIGVTSAMGSTFFPDTFFQSYIFQAGLLLLLLNMSLCTIRQAKTFWQTVSLGKEKGGVKRIGVIILHAGIVLILIGGTVNSLIGQKADISMTNGEVINLSDVLSDNDPLKIKLNEFYIEFNPDGSPCQYFSKVSLIKELGDSQEFTISVNNPLAYNGVKVYQQTFGYLLKVQTEFDSRAVTKKTLREGDVLQFEGSDKSLKFVRYIPNYDPRYGMISRTTRPDNPKVIYAIYQNNSLIKAGIGSIAEKIEIDTVSFVTLSGIEYYTGLGLKQDPGLPIAAAGGILLMVGSCCPLLMRRKSK